MTDTTRIVRVADALADQHARRARYEPLAGDLALPDLDAAYDVQRRLIAGWEAGAKGPIAGYKIALTSKAVQELCGVNQSLVGAIFASTVHKSPAVVKLSDFVRVGLEFELCLKMGSDLFDNSGKFTAEIVRDAVELAVPAFELIEDRDADYSRLDGVSMAADNAWSGGIVLGETTGDWRSLDLVTTPVRLEYNDEVEEAVTGAAMGNPLTALAWVANLLAEQGRPLRAGHWVMTGSTVKTRYPKAGDRAVYTVEGLGSVEVEVAD
ncbi:2-keto-4-pentenoate hydratase [Thalassobaculum salexigens]|uniref:2-keto-4-pentenoate hydratase n=1 Tax=Thalassobaculum salexigens TaxID=455360 RepID=UPI0004134632|nr:fumarylacetoacetate hydrolase family protein [Thalassobaculum salexigens]